MDDTTKQIKTLYGCLPSACGEIYINMELATNMLLIWFE